MISGFVPSQLKEARLLANFRFIVATPTGAGGSTSNLRQALICSYYRLRFQLDFSILYPAYPGPHRVTFAMVIQCAVDP